MTVRTTKDPSPFKSGLVHGSLGFATLAVVLGSAGAIVHLMGDADAASPTVRVALFDGGDEVTPDLKSRLPDEDAVNRPVLVAYPEMAESPDDIEPDLGVEYDPTAIFDAVETEAETVTEPQGIRINGKTVMPGQSLSQVSAGAARPDGARLVPASISGNAAQPAAPAQTQGQVTAFEKHSRPFENTAKKPTVSIIIGGLGINERHTAAAIAELPPEITLSFAPTAKNLPLWVRRARAAGHEVLIEVPMEPYDYGRDQPHPQILQVAVSADTNQERLKTLLAQVSGYAGVTNYRGGKFATSAEAVLPVMDVIDKAGLAFFEDGSLSRSTFGEIASAKGVPFGQAGAVLDARPEGDEIETQLLLLEAQALETGAALGSGFAYPITVDLLKVWVGRLDSKGIVLAPASHFAKQRMAAGQDRAETLNSAG